MTTGEISASSRVSSSIPAVKVKQLERVIKKEAPAPKEEEVTSASKSADTPEQRDLESTQATSSEAAEAAPEEQSEFNKGTSIRA